MSDLELDGVNSKAKINKIESDTGSTVTLGKVGDTLTLGSGATLGSIFDPSQTVTWSSTIITSDTTLASGNGYFVNTTSSTITVTLPASPSVGDYLQIKDYAGTFATNNLTIARNGSNIQGEAFDSLISTNRAALKLVYADATKGWLYVEESNVGDFGPLFTATGGTITESGDFKIHTFTSSGTFQVTKTSPNSNTVDYLVVAGGGGGGGIGAAQGAGAGGGAGGFRQSFPNPATGGFPISVTSYPITVGGGGTGGVYPPSSNGGDGSNSVFSTITSAGGGGGGESVNNTPVSGNNGGSGGGGGSAIPTSVTCSGGSGNTPSVSPPQGNNGGNGFSAPFGSVSNRSAGGGGGAGAVGANANGDGGAGGNGTTTTITGSSNTYAGGGGGGDRSTHPAGAGGSGGGGTGSGNDNNATDGTANTGGGGGGFGGPGAPLVPAGDGGSGIVIIRYKFK